jgi:hypothetical protein
VNEDNIEDESITDEDFIDENMLDIKINRNDYEDESDEYEENSLMDIDS